MAGAASQSLSILLLAGESRGMASTVRDHIQSFRRYSRHRIRTFNPRRLKWQPTSLDLDAFDVVVIHYTLFLPAEWAVPTWLREKLRAFQGLKVQFIQDEYRRVDEVTAAMRDVGIDVLFSAVPAQATDAVYGGRLDGIEVISTLTGYLTGDLLGVKASPLRRRPVEVGYRGRVVPYWLGALGQEKVAVGRDFLARAEARGLVCDIAWGELDRLYGKRWNRFLASCRTILNTESGASIVDFDGSIEGRAQAYLDEHPSSAFADVHAAVLAPYEGNVVINVVSPRVLEAAALRTAIVAFPGEYSGVIRADEHYVPLEKDFSNFDDVVERIRDLPALEAMVERTHADVVRSGLYSYETFARRFDEIVAERAIARATAKPRSSRHAQLDAAGLLLGLGLGLKTAGGTLRRGLAIGRLVALDRDLQRVVAVYLRDAELRRRVARGRLTNDLLRLGIIRRAHLGQSATTARFSVETTLNAATGTLALTSRSGLSQGSGFSAETIRNALENGSVREIVWNHRAVSTGFNYIPLLGWRRVRVQVGYYGQVGVHEFGALRELAARQPEIVWRALRPLTGAARQPIRSRRSFHRLLKQARRALRRTRKVARRKLRASGRAVRRLVHPLRWLAR